MEENPSSVGTLEKPLSKKPESSKFLIESQTRNENQIKTPNQEDKSESKINEVKEQIAAWTEAGKLRRQQKNRPEQENITSQIPAKHDFLRNIKNRLFYTDMDTVMKVITPSLGLSISAQALGSLVGLPPEITLPAVLAGLVIPTIESVSNRMRSNRIGNLNFIKVASPHEIYADGQNIAKGEFIAELHADKAKNLSKVSNILKVMQFEKQSLTNFFKAVDRIKNDDPAFKDIQAIYAKSDVFAPWMKDIGFDIKQVNPSELFKAYLRLKKIRDLGPIKGLLSPIGDIYEMTIPRSQLTDPKTAEIINSRLKVLEERITRKEAFEAGRKKLNLFQKTFQKIKSFLYSNSRE